MIRCKKTDLPVDTCAHCKGRCKKTDLPVGTCAHCKGVDLPAEVVDWTTTNPFPLPPARPAVPVAEVYRTKWRRNGVLSDLEDLYLRLIEGLPAESVGRSNDNAAGRAQADKRRAPVRIEVHDLIARIEETVPELAAAVCDALGSIRCLAYPHGTDAGRLGPDCRVEVALDTLDRHWSTFEESMPEMAAEVDSRISRLVASARRLVGETTAPVPLVVWCPSCQQPTIFRLDTEAGPIVVCGNPDDLDTFGARRQWDEYQWEEANDPRFSSSTASR